MDFRSIIILYVLSIIFPKITYAQSNINGTRSFVWNEHLKYRVLEKQKRGVAIYNDEVNVKYFRAKKHLFNIKFGKPVVVYRAKKKYGWGFVQFPRIFRNIDSNLVAIWNMNEDHIKAKRKISYKISYDKGKTWKPVLYKNIRLRGLTLPFGESLSFRTCFHDMDSLNLSVKSFYDKGKYSFYNYGIPNEFRGFLSSKKNDKGEVRKFVAPIKYLDSIVFHSNENMLSQQAWGEIKLVNNTELYTCQYPVFKVNREGTVNPSTIGFFKSLDFGETWEMINILSNSVLNKNKIVGFTEPSFTFLNEKEVMCIARTGGNYEKSPMYMSYSCDKANSFSKPEIIAPNGVLPKLLTLDDKVVVLSSGRPGVQVRFFTSEDNEWSDAFELLRHTGLKGQVSCGYTGLVKLDQNKFLIIYSDFRNRDNQNNISKAIIVREIVIDKVE